MCSIMIVKHTSKYKITCSILLIILFQSNCAYSKNAVNSTSEIQNFELCLNEYVYFEDNINASFVVDDILSKINLSNTYFITKVCIGINNAIAINMHGVRYILLDVNWMEGLKNDKNDWFHLFVISHEIGHHVLKHTEYQTQSNMESRKQELEADQFAGYVLGMYGASENDINSLLNKFPENNNPNSTHPQNDERIKAIKKGYYDSKTEETNVLIQSITRNADVNLNNLPYLITLARRNSNNFIKSGDKTYLTNAIDYYKQAIRFYEDNNVKYELASMLLANGDVKSYFETLEYIYKSTNTTEYLIELLSSSISLKYQIDHYTDKYGILLRNIDPAICNNIHSAISLSRYYNYMVSNSTSKQDYVNLTYTALNIADKLNSSVITKDQSYYYSAGEIFNELGLLELRQDNYNKALSNFIEAESNFNKGNNYNDYSQENTHLYYSFNILVIYANIAGSHVRLRNWEEGFTFVNKYINYWTNLNHSQKWYLLSVKNIDSDIIYYFKGRCEHGLEKYNDAITSYNLVEYSSSLNPGSLQYYRGLSYSALYNNVSACSDFEYACNQGIDRACVRFKTMCKK